MCALQSSKMKKMINEGTKTFLSTIFFFCVWGNAAFAEGISLSKEHPGYWSYRGETILLIGGWDHGHNPFLDHSTIDGGGYEDTSSKEEIVDALDELADCGGNFLRCVLDPGVAAGRQHFMFCKKVDGQYDLNQMEGPFWDRLDFFLCNAQKRNIIVGLEIWDRFDWYNGGHAGWPNSPFNPQNNINYTTESSGLKTSYAGKGDHSENPFGLTTPEQSAYKNASPQKKSQFDLVRRYQERFIDKLLSITFAYDNIIYSANNEVRHQEPAWGKYWINYIRAAAAREKKQVICTDMFWDILDVPDSEGFDYLMANKEFYDYFDVSQTSAHRNHQQLNPAEAGEMHWNKILYCAEKGRRANRLIHLNKIYGSKYQADGWMGSGQNAIEEFWRSLIAGAAGVRFHRPESGLGLSKNAQNNIRAVRLVEKQVHFWDVQPNQALLSDRQQNEAYLAAQPGEKYILFFPHGGTVGLDLSAYKGSKFNVNWVNLSKGEFGPSNILNAGDIAPIEAPGNNGWVAVIVSEL